MPTTSTFTERHRERRNVSQPERIASVAGGGALMFLGLQRKSLTGLGLAAIGGSLLYRGITGHCNAYRVLGVNTAPRGTGRNVSVPYELGLRVDHKTVIERSPADVYNFWRNLENLPRFMRHLESVKEVDNRHSVWVVKAPAGRSVQWKAEIINEIEGRLIAWRSLEGADVDNAGSVHFRPLQNGRATEVSIELQYNPPGGVVGAAVAKLFGEEPSGQIKDDMECLKQLLETGSIDKTARTKQQSASRWNRDAVGMASEESFPASDPPSWTPEALAH